MNLYLVKRTEDWDYDEWDAAVVAVDTPDEAKLVSPSDYGDAHIPDYWTPDKLEVSLVGVGAMKPGLILASFNAG